MSSFLKKQVLNLDIFHDNNYVVFILKRIFSFEFFKVDEKDSSNDTLAYEDDAQKVNLCTFGHFFNFAKLHLQLGWVGFTFDYSNHPATLPPTWPSWAELAVIQLNQNEEDDI